MSKRLRFLTVTIILIICEVLIALFVHDRFVRPYLGDVIVVWVIYSFARIFIQNRCKLLPIYVFIFSATVEVLQLFNYSDLLGLGNIGFFRILMGSVFDIKDIICYAVGCIVLGIHEIVVYNNNLPK